MGQVNPVRFVPRRTAQKEGSFLALPLIAAPIFCPHLCFWPGGDHRSHVVELVIEVEPLGDIVGPEDERHSFVNFRAQWVRKTIRAGSPGSQSRSSPKLFIEPVSPAA